MYSSGFKETNNSSAANTFSIKGNGNTHSSAFRGTTTQHDNFKVLIRVRPALQREMEVDLPFRSVALVDNDNTSVNLVEYLGAELSERERQREWVESPNLFQLHRFPFDFVFDMDSTQQTVYEITAKPAVTSILEGYNSTIFAYGQTGTGKTYTMEGFTYSSTDSQRGIIPRSIEEIFNHIESHSSAKTKFLVRASYLQIYNESINDLLKPEKNYLQIREDKKKGIFVEGLSDWAVRSPTDIYTLLQKGAQARATASTKMNDISSRSHAVFVITVEQMTIVDDENNEATTQIKVGKLNLVDLAGSERIRVTGATGKQLDESKKINKSLSALGNVIYALTDTKGRTHIPYRDSKLTRLLEDSLGGNCKTTMMAMISPSHESFNESLSSLHFARRAKNIKNRPKINEDVDHRALIRQYEVQLKKLRTELEEKTRQIHSNEVVMELEEQKKQAEEDKQAAIDALEEASNQYLQERDEKKRLEMKIQMMNSQMIIGGNKIEDTPQFRSALEERQTILLKEFDEKLQEFEKERQQIEEDKAQVERYKQLLLKQRDIMIALTNKLNERDEAIVQLQEELDAYDKINREQEDFIQNKNQRISMLENILRRSNIKIPEEQNNPMDNYNSRGKLDKVYLPYEAEKNANEHENTPLSLLSPDEKVRELKSVIQEQEKEINILKIVSQRVLGKNEGKENLNRGDLGNTNLNDSRRKLEELEKEKLYLVKQLEDQNDVVNFQKEENEKLNEQIENFERDYEQLEEENSKMHHVKDELIYSLDKIIRNMGSSSAREVKGDLISILQMLYENSNSTTLKNLQETQSKAPNSYQESQNEDKKRVSYVTENYERYKEQQNVKKRGENKFINQNYYNNPNLAGNAKTKSVTPPRSTVNKSVEEESYAKNSGQPTKINSKAVPMQSHQEQRGSNAYLNQNQQKPLTPNLNSKLKSDIYINKFINK